MTSCSLLPIYSSYRCVES